MRAETAAVNTDAFNAFLARFGWQMLDKMTDSETEADFELKDSAGKTLAWIHHRPHYCDRGHWQVGIEPLSVRDLDGQDAFPRYFMRLEHAKLELVEFMAWRLHKVRASA